MFFRVIMLPIRNQGSSGTLIKTKSFETLRSSASAVSGFFRCSSTSVHTTRSNSLSLNGSLVTEPHRKSHLSEHTDFAYSKALADSSSSVITALGSRFSSKAAFNPSPHPASRIFTVSELQHLKASSAIRFCIRQTRWRFRGFDD